MSEIAIHQDDGITIQTISHVDVPETYRSKLVQTKLSPLAGLLPEKPVLCVVFGLLGAALKDVVVELGAGAAGEDRDEVGAGVLALVPILHPRVRPQILLLMPLC